MFKAVEVLPEVDQNDPGIFFYHILHKSRRMLEQLFDERDPEAIRLASEASNDMSYKRMVDHIKDRTPMARIEERFGSKTNGRMLQYAKHPRVQRW